MMTSDVEIEIQKKIKWLFLCKNKSKWKLNKEFFYSFYFVGYKEFISNIAEIWCLTFYSFNKFFTLLPILGDILNSQAMHSFYSVCLLLLKCLGVSADSWFKFNNWEKLLTQFLFLFHSCVLLLWLMIFIFISTRHANLQTCKENHLRILSTFQ